MELHVWVGDYGLASITVDCLRSILYVKLCKAPVQIVCSNNPYSLLFCDYPIFKHGHILMTEYCDMVSYLKMRNYAVDYGLSGKQVSEAYALLNMVVMNLKPMYEHVTWVDDRNYQALTSMWYRRAMPFPFSYLYLYKRRREALAYEKEIFNSGDETCGEDKVKEQITEKAADCFMSLAVRLGQNEYFYGNYPTTLDVIVYAYLTVMMKIPYPSDYVVKMLGKWPSLYKYVERIDRTIFPEVVYQRKYIRQFGGTSIGNRKEDKEYDDISISWPMKIFVLAAVTSLMLGYAVSNDLVDMERWRRVIIG